MSHFCCTYFFPNSETGCFGREKQRSLVAGPQMNPTTEQSILWVQYSGYSGLGDNGTLRFISKEKAIERLREIHSSPSGVCKVVGLNILVRQFGLRFHCNGIKQLAKDLLKAVMAKNGHCKWSLFINVPLLPYSARIMLGVNSIQFSLHLLHLFGTHHFNGKERTVFLTSGEEKLIYSIFSLVLYSARIMLGVKSVQFPLHQGRKSLVTAFSLSYSIRHSSF